MVKRLLQHDILWLEVCMNDGAGGVDMVQGDQNLMSDVLHDWHRDAPVVIGFNQSQQVVPKHLVIQPGKDQQSSESVNLLYRTTLFALGI